MTSITPVAANDPSLVKLASPFLKYWYLIVLHTPSGIGFIGSIILINLYHSGARKQVSFACHILDICPALIS